MKIQNLPTPTPRTLSSKNPQTPQPGPRDDFQFSGDLRSRLESAAFGAILLGGSAALGHAYASPGCWGAAGLAGLSGFVLCTQAKGSELETCLFGGALLAAVASGCAYGGHVMGPGFSLAAAGVGAGLGYLSGGKK